MGYRNRITDAELQQKISPRVWSKQTDEAAGNLLKLASILDTHTKAPKSLNIITGTGISYSSSDGINVISLASLGA